MLPIDAASRQHELLEDGWAHLRTLLPHDLDEGAARTQALRRRRGVNSAADLLRMLLAYSTADLSLKDVAAWAKGMKLSTMSTEALFYRVRDAEGWLAELLSEQVSVAVRPVHTGLRLRIVDATVLTGPGSEGTDWRLHAFWDAAVLADGAQRALMNRGALTELRDRRRKRRRAKIPDSFKGSTSLSLS